MFRVMSWAKKCWYSVSYLMTFIKRNFFFKTSISVYIIVVKNKHFTNCVKFFFVSALLQYTYPYRNTYFRGIGPKIPANFQENYKNSRNMLMNTEKSVIHCMLHVNHYLNWLYKNVFLHFLSSLLAGSLTDVTMVVLCMYLHLMCCLQVPCG
jgi:hypothetical protein